MSGKNFMSYGDADTILTEFSNDIKSRVSTKANQGLTSQQIANAKANIDIDKVPNVATNDQTPTFLEESTRTNIASGDKLSLIFGKIKKFFSDLKPVAFSGSYNDLSDQINFDNVPTQNSNNAVKSGGTKTYVDSAVSQLNAEIGVISTRINKNSLGSVVEITSYTTSSNRYTCPSDGYVKLLVNGGGAGWVYINGQILLSSAGSSSGHAVAMSVYVRKGMTVYITGGSLSSLYFFPIS